MQCGFGDANKNKSRMYGLLDISFSNIDLAISVWSDHIRGRRSTRNWNHVRHFVPIYKYKLLIDVTVLLELFSLYYVTHSHVVHPCFPCSHSRVFSAPDVYITSHKNDSFINEKFKGCDVTEQRVDRDKV